MERERRPGVAWAPGCDSEGLQASLDRVSADRCSPSARRAKRQPPCLWKTDVKGPALSTSPAPSRPLKPKHQLIKSSLGARGNEAQRDSAVLAKRGAPGRRAHRVRWPGLGCRQELSDGAGSWQVVGGGWWEALPMKPGGN